MYSDIADDLAVITDTIIDLLPLAKVYLFGSFANGTLHPESDIDLCVIVPELNGNRFEIMDEIREAIHSKTKYPVDLLVFSMLEFEKNADSKSKIQNKIAHEGVLLNV